MRFLYIAILLSLSESVTCKDKPVKVSLSAKWSATPLLLEASEFMAEEGLFLEFVKRISADTVNFARDDETYHFTMKKAKELLSVPSAKLLELALAMRINSPKVQVHQQIATTKNQDGCDAFAEICSASGCGKTTCDPSKVKEMVKTVGSSSGSSALYKSDSTHCVSDCDKLDRPVVIVYGQLGNSNLNEFLSKDFGAYTILRHYVKEISDEKVRLSGYGVELAVKSTEYKAQDDSKKEGEMSEEPLVGEVSGFNFTRLSERFPDLRKQLLEYKNALADSSNELRPLKVWQTQDLSLQAAQKALSASEESPLTQLTVLRDTSQNFPSLAASLTKVSVKSEFKKAVSSLHKELEKLTFAPGDSALYINGVDLDVDSLDMFSLFDVLRSDLTIMEKLAKNGLANDDIGSLLKLISKSQEQQYALDIRDSAISFINDLENDDMYARWPKTLNALLQPTFPGMMRYMSRNLFNLVLMFDVTDLSIKSKLTFMKTLYEHQTPIRIGLVPVAMPGDMTGQLLARVYYHLVSEKDAPDALNILLRFYEKMEHDNAKEVTSENIKDFFKAFTDDLAEADNDEEYSDSQESAFQFYQRSGLRQLPQLLLNGAVLKKIDEDSIEETVVTEVLQSTPTYQKAVYHGQLSDRMDPVDWLMNQDHVMPRLNPRVLSAEKTCLDMSGSDSDTKFDVLKGMQYLVKKDYDVITGVTVLVIVDLDSVEGREIMYNAIKQMKANGKLRVGLIHNPVAEKTGFSVANAVQVAMETLSMAEARSFVTKLVKEENIEALEKGEKTLEDLSVHGMDIDAYKTALDAGSEVISQHSKYVRTELLYAPGEMGVISNGQLIGPLDKEEEFTQDDFMLLEKFSSGSMMSKVISSINKQGLTGKEASDVASAVMGALSCSKSERNRKDVSLPAESEAMIKLPATNEGPAFEVTAIVDPVSRSGQKLLPIILTLQKVVNCDLKVYLNCRDKLSEIPLKSFYRYVLEPEVKFNVAGEQTAGPEAVFTILPHKSLLTMNVQPPESWLVESVKAVHDLDNIKLDDVKSGVSAAYELEYLLLEGHCYDGDTSQPPRGLQIILGTDARQQSAVVDTLVMANLGYFQLKATPGVWHLMLREGRSTDLYHISSHEYTDSPSDSDQVVILMDSFKSKIINLRVKKNPGMENQELLADETEEEDGRGIWNSLSSSFSGSKGDDDKDEYLNIFSLASGHLYERFLRIMILSVTKQSSAPVKFWLLKNYLSPAFKDFIPFMAEKYGFKYELVQYKWPRWLNQQTEKQRVMWGYKILFLDVLFPMGVKKIAFIDADQTVRTDIQELFDLDLGGAPYGYTPFCSSRTEMDGFRFWKSGYWANHLGHRPYHISALYVVDLKKFRKIAAGDRLRGQYQALSQDPNSLSNLDQDLPNNMIHQVKIKSLPQEWLWCETWCSDESKPAAKTIDLCNNPKTKEPKLEAAKRIVPEWVDYDNEIKELWDMWEAKQETDTIGTQKDTEKHDEL